MINDVLSIKELLKDEGEIWSFLQFFPDPIFIVDGYGKPIEVNEAACKLLGYNREELLQITVAERTAPEDLVTFQKLKETGRNMAEVALIKKDGSRVLTEVHGIRLGNNIFMGIFRDLTDRKKTEAVLRKSEQQYRMIFEHSPLGIVHFDQNGVITKCNNQCLKIIGTPREKIIGSNIITLMKDEKMREAVLIALTGHLGRYEGIYQSVSGNKTTYLKATYSSIVSGDGLCQGGIGVFEDLTEKRKAEEKIIFQANLLNQVRNAVIATDLSGKIIFWNKWAETLYQWKVDEAIGRPITKLIISPDHGKTDEAIRSEVLKEGHWEGEFIDRKKDGSEVFVYSVITSIKNTEGETIGTIGVSTDITEKKRLENELARLDRLNLVGEMAAGIGHEVRNPLTSVRGFLQLLSAKNENSHQQEIFKLMIDELDRANSIITEYLKLAKNKVINLQRHNLGRIIENLLPLLQADAVLTDKYFTIELQDTPDLLLDHTEITQLIINLAQNGLQAMGAGGCLTIKTYVDADDVILAVQDQGAGIPAEVLEKLGTPFITTKENGTGLGLAVCYSIAARHNAVISVESGDQGAAFLVRFKS